MPKCSQELPLCGEFQAILISSFLGIFCALWIACEDYIVEAKEKNILKRNVKIFWETRYNANISLDIWRLDKCQPPDICQGKNREEQAWTLGRSAVPPLEKNLFYTSQSNLCLLVIWDKSFLSPAGLSSLLALMG